MFEIVILFYIVDTEEKADSNNSVGLFGFLSVYYEFSCSFSEFEDYYYFFRDVVKSFDVIS